MASLQGIITRLKEFQWPTVMSVQATAGGAMPEGHEVVASLRVKRQELLEEVSKMQARRCTCHIPQLFLT